MPLRECLADVLQHASTSAASWHKNNHDHDHEHDHYPGGGGSAGPGRGRGRGWGGADEAAEVDPEDVERVYDSLAQSEKIVGGEIVHSPVLSIGQFIRSIRSVHSFVHSRRAVM